MEDEKQNGKLHPTVHLLFIYIILQVLKAFSHPPSLVTFISAHGTGQVSIRHVRVISKRFCYENIGQLRVLSSGSFTSYGYRAVDDLDNQGHAVFALMGSSGYVPLRHGHGDAPMYICQCTDVKTRVIMRAILPMSHTAHPRPCTPSGAGPLIGHTALELWTTLSMCH